MPSVTSKAIGGLIAGVLMLGTGQTQAKDNSILVQSTTSAQSSGLFERILPMFKDRTGFKVNVVAAGTGQAIKNAKNCDGDVLFVHAKAAEEAFVADGHGIRRYDVMYNDFVIVGPPDDPAKISGGRDAAKALAAIAETKAVFASRGDDSGTHKKELSLWKTAGIDVDAASGTWYRETGSGMGATLNAGVGMGAYALTDRATWSSFKNKRGFEVHIEGDPALFNQYGIVPVNPEKCPNVNAAGAESLVAWFLSAEGQKAIGGYRIAGQQLFFPNAAE